PEASMIGVSEVLPRFFSASICAWVGFHSSSNSALSAIFRSLGSRMFSGAPGCVGSLLGLGAYMKALDFWMSLTIALGTPALVGSEVSLTALVNDSTAGPCCLSWS